MISLTNKRDCCGCGACAQACPMACINLRTDGEGFYYPEIDSEICVKCGVCRKVCPIINVSAIKNEPEHVYAAYAACDDIRMASSSGGIFSLLARRILNQNGVVFGAALADDLSVHHVKVETAEELQRLRGSKYLQSRIEDTYTQTREALEQGRTVLFSGVGCQIVGLEAFLRKKYQNLYTVDVLCHGVPSPKVWRFYLDSMERNNASEIKEALFRSKRMGWHNFASELVFCSGESYCKSHKEDAFMQCFLSNICLRPSCHSCCFREGKSGADITLGDAWGIEKWLPELDDDKGTSLVLVNTERGRALWKEICDQTNCREVEAGTALAHNMVYRHSVKAHPNRSRFFEALNRGATLDVLVMLTRKPLWRRCASFTKRVVKKLLRV